MTYTASTSSSRSVQEVKHQIHRYINSLDIMLYLPKGSESHYVSIVGLDPKLTQKQNGAV